METRRRSLAKAILWNMIGLLCMSLIGLAMTGSAAIGGAMAVVNTVLGFCLYVIYERLWARIDWGRVDV
ncbi:DUF2061 domain-containing protein [Salibaculum griseiflavum]|uniref:DUF2061 domain-containing protein n=1 Tax=Salibaculum griseiflavum TaxID=1914409 RepID=A0A2V1P464_9RHOB|nr:DUF2061 domain-containing protein [Salibaculum griseiflavum]PWG16207.1 hypothetical protein DFK10_12765 [Salibaculum griseiflavum]